MVSCLDLTTPRATGITVGFFRVFSTLANERDANVGLALRTMFSGCSLVHSSSWAATASSDIDESIRKVSHRRLKALSAIYCECLNLKNSTKACILYEYTLNEVHNPKMVVQQFIGL